jgi:hypothetical protein
MNTNQPFQNSIMMFAFTGMMPPHQRMDTVPAGEPRRPWLFAGKRPKPS